MSTSQPRSFEIHQASRRTRVAGQLADAPVGPGTCLGVLLEYDADPGETVVQDWWAARDLPGLVPGGYGTFRYAKTVEYSVGGGDSSVEQHSDVLAITYEIVEIAR
jgi:hypothetical protein